MKLTLPQLRKLVESTVKDVKKRSLKESKKVTCPECGSDEIEFDLIDMKGEFNECQDCGAEFDRSDEDTRLHRPDFEVGVGKQPSHKIGGMKASLDRHVKESRMRTRRR